MARYASSTTTLAGNGEWSGIIIPEMADKVVGAVYSSHAGTIWIEQSIDQGTHWDIQTSYAIPAADGTGFSEEVLAPLIRVRFVNGPTQQTEFRIAAKVSSAGSR